MLPEAIVTFSRKFFKCWNSGDYFYIGENLGQVPLNKWSHSKTDRKIYVIWHQFFSVTFFPVKENTLFFLSIWVFWVHYIYNFNYWNFWENPKKQVIFFINKIWSWPFWKWAYKVVIDLSPLILQQSFTINIFVGLPLFSSVLVTTWLVRCNTLRVFLAWFLSALQEVTRLIRKHINWIRNLFCERFQHTS